LTLQNRLMAHVREFLTRKYPEITLPEPMPLPAALNPPASLTLHPAPPI
jgi:hypothetical protein